MIIELNSDTGKVSLTSPKIVTGTGSADLSNYYTKAEVDGALADYVLMDEMEHALEELKEEVVALIPNYESGDEVSY